MKTFTGMGGVALLLCACSQPPAQAQPPQVTFQPMLDSLRTPAYVQRQLNYSPAWSFIRYDHNVVEWTDTLVMKTFFRALARPPQGRVRILHIGDSHVQADIYPGQARHRLQQHWGHGGRGSMFPYAAAKTHAAYDYATAATGTWTWARNIQAQPALPLGLSGATVQTTDSGATFRWRFTDSLAVVNQRHLRLLCATGPGTADLALRLSNGDTLWVRTDTLPLQQSFTDISLPASPHFLEVTVAPQPQRGQRYARFYGLQLLQPSGPGLEYHSVGINGAGFQSLLRQELMPDHLHRLDPHLIILDVGGNDFYLGGLNAEVYAADLRACIQRIRSGAPAASILITCPMDLYRRGRHVPGSLGASQVARRVAREMHCAFWDFYTVAGGAHAMLKWRYNNLAKPDRVHQTTEGYQLKGELLTAALLQSYSLWLAGRAQVQVADTLVRGQLAAAPPASRTEQAGPPPVVRPVSGRTYTVQRGDVLGSIARDFGVTVLQLRAWNGLEGDLIREGQQLVVAATAGATTVRTSNPPPSKPPTATAGKGRSHTVQSGDTLWKLAQQYGTTVAALKQANGLASDALKPGQVLRIP